MRVDKSLAEAIKNQKRIVNERFGITISDAQASKVWFETMKGVRKPKDFLGMR